MTRCFGGSTDVLQNMTDKKCTVPNCDRPLLAKGLCGMHRYRAKQGLPMTATTEELEAQRRAKISQGNTGKVRTQEAKDKHAALARAKWESGVFKGRPHAPEAKEKLRQAGLRQAEEGRINKDGLAIGASRTAEERSAAWTPEKKAVQAENTLRAYQDGRMQVHGHTKGVWSLYNGPKGQFNMRSQSELLFAYKLDWHEIDWQYEPQRFDLGWATYCPDFYLPAHDLWVEVKGHLTETAARKIADFRALGHNLVLTTYREVRAAGLPFPSNTLQST